MLFVPCHVFEAVAASEIDRLRSRKMIKIDLEDLLHDVDHPG